MDRRDEFPHDLCGNPDSNESVYFDFYDPSIRVGGFTKIERWGDSTASRVTTCCFLSDGRVAFSSRLSPETGQASFDSPGVEVDVVRPLEEVALAYRGEVRIPDEPRDRRSWGERQGGAPPVPVEVDMNFAAAAPVYVGRGHGGFGGREKGLPLGSYYQFVTVMGQIRVDRELWLVEGHGLRSHTWGAAHRQPLYRRRITAGAGPTFGFALWWDVGESGVAVQDGFLWDGTSLHSVDRSEVNSTWAGADSHPDCLDVEVCSGDARIRAQGKLAPLMVLPDVELPNSHQTAQGLARWTFEDGRIGYGVAEFSDALVEGIPAGTGL